MAIEIQWNIFDYSDIRKEYKFTINQRKKIIEAKERNIKMLG
jgi:hypothetical protein